MRTFNKLKVTTPKFNSLQLYSEWRTYRVNSCWLTSKSSHHVLSHGNIHPDKQKFHQQFLQLQHHDTTSFRLHSHQVHPRHWRCHNTHRSSANSGNYGYSDWKQSPLCCSYLLFTPLLLPHVFSLIAVRNSSQLPRSKPGILISYAVHTFTRTLGWNHLSSSCFDHTAHSCCIETLHHSSHLYSDRVILA